MKNILIVFMALPVLFAGCTGNNENSFIPGIYTRSYSQEYAIGNDTLIIAAVAGQNSTFSITKKSAYNRIRDSWLQNKTEHTIKRYTAVYDAGQKVLRETTHGIVLFLSRQDNTLQWGPGVYKKLK
jgi:hypothetical protein